MAITCKFTRNKTRNIKIDSKPLEEESAERE